MKFKTSRKLKNVFLNITFAIMALFSHLSISLKKIRVGKHYVFFLDGNKNCCRHKNSGSVGFVETQFM